MTSTFGFVAIVFLSTIWYHQLAFHRFPLDLFMRFHIWILFFCNCFSLYNIINNWHFGNFDLQICFYVFGVWILFFCNYFSLQSGINNWRFGDFDLWIFFCVFGVWILFFCNWFHSLQSSINNRRFAILTFGFVYAFPMFGFFSFAIGFSLYNLVSTIGISVILTFRFVYAFLAFGLFSFAIVYLSRIWYQQLTFR